MDYPKTLFKHGEAKEVKDSGEEAKAREQGFTEPYKFQEYPKVLHKNGDRAADDLVVETAEEEAAAREDGYRTIHEAESEAPEPKKAKKAAK